MTYPEFSKKLNEISAKSPDKAVSFVRQVSNDKTIRSRKIINKALLVMAIDNFDKADYGKCEAHLKKIIQHYGKFPDAETYCVAFNILGIIKGFNKDNYMALFYLDEARKIAFKNNLTSDFPMIFSNMAEQYVELFDNEKAVASMLSAIKYTKPDNPYIGSLYFNLSYIYFLQKDYKKSQETLDLSINKYKMKQDETTAFLFKTYSQIQISDAMGEKDKFQAELETLKKKLETTDVDGANVQSFLQITDVLFQFKCFDTLKTVIDKLNEYSAKNPQKELLGSICSIGEKYYLALGDYKNAYEYACKSKDLIQEKLKTLSFEAKESIKGQMTLARLVRENRESKKRNAELRSQSMTDSLTGLYNRHAFNESLTAHSAKFSSYPHFGCALMDIDCFKMINDTYGHLSGDEVLAQFGKTLQEFINPSIRFYRFGGDEFVAFFENFDAEKVDQIFSQVKDSIEKLQFTSMLNGESFGVTCSIGIFNSAYPLDSVVSYLNKADGLLYKAKSKEGKGQIIHEEGKPTES
jgi:diguanylate cyclase (GGDEF)-like protein